MFHILSDWSDLISHMLFKFIIKNDKSLFTSGPFY